MRLQDLAQNSGQLAVASEKASQELAALLGKWFTKHFVKGIKLPLLRAMYGTATFSAFSRCLAEHDETAVIAVLRKIDPFSEDIFRRTRSEMEAHIQGLAAGRIQPTARPRKTKSDKGPSGKPVRIGGVYERSRL
jgi:hypothetical protein